MLVLHRDSTKCASRGIMINLHDLGVKLALKAHNECIKQAQMVCNFTPNKVPKKKPQLSLLLL